MQLNEIYDPRDGYALARRNELARHCRELGHLDITEEMPKELIVKLMKAKGIAPPRVRPRPLGGDPRSADTSATSHKYNGSAAQAVTKVDTVVIDVVELAEQEWLANQPKATDKMTFNELRAEAKKRGHKLNRKMRLDDYRKLLDGE